MEMRSIPKYHTLEEALDSLNQADLEKRLAALNEEAIHELDRTYLEAYDELFAGMSEEERMAAHEVMFPGSRERIRCRSQELVAWATTLPK
ncbi:MAG: hypothetical protein IPJ68_00450 [Candidatus Moraniibacteriota bacterium]|nr:MAG: hypothetical protein IPJ68_00450 [Candidatus Moranbacteria bacterium]